MNLRVWEAVSDGEDPACSEVPSVGGCSGVIRVHVSAQRVIPDCTTHESHKTEAGPLNLQAAVSWDSSKELDETSWTDGHTGLLEFQVWGE